MIKMIFHRITFVVTTLLCASVRSQVDGPSSISKFYEHTKSTEGNSISTGSETSDVRKCTTEPSDLYAVADNFFHFDDIFIPASGSKSASKCNSHSILYVNGLKQLDVWALKMYDSSAHLTSGVLNGNINQFGDFDQCLALEGPEDDLKGFYCLANIQIKLKKHHPKLKTLHRMVHSNYAFLSDINDPGHRIPRFTTINWALCVPASCSPEDIEISFKEFLRNRTSSTVDIAIRIDPQMCQKKDDSKIDNGTIRTVAFFIIVLALCCSASLYEIITHLKCRNEWLNAFSFRTNFNWLTRTDDDEDNIKAVHGIRFINAVMLLFSHKSMAVFFNPYVNRTQLSQILGRSWTVIGRAASLYTDPFLMFSGMLVSYSMVGRLQRNRHISYKSEYLGRILRILPGLVALILFCTHILPQMGSGPQWNLVVGHHANLCKKYWWRNFLFLHNYFGFSDMCLTHTHHIGIDTQLFIVAPIVTYSLWKNPTFSINALFSFMFLTTAFRFYTTVAHNLSNYVYFGITTQKLLKTADYMYTSPIHRSTVYAMGILLGFILRNYKNFKLSNEQLKIGWIISTLCLVTTFFAATFMSDSSYKYNAFHAGCYAAFAPLTWCSFFVWIVFTSHYGYESTISKMLSWSGFQITTKLSYAIYLTQFPVFFYNVGRRRSTEYYNFFEIMINTNEYICIILSSLILTLMFDTPFKNIKMLLLRKNIL